MNWNGLKWVHFYRLASFQNKLARFLITQLKMNCSVKINVLKFVTENKILKLAGFTICCRVLCCVIK